MFKSEQKRAYYSTAAIKFCLDLLLIVVCVTAFVRSGQLFWIVAIFVGATAFELLLSFYRFLQTIAVAQFFMKSSRVDMIADMYHRHSFPEPDEFHEDAIDYFARSIEDEGLPVGVRIEMAKNLGALQQMQITGPHSVRIVTEIDCENALKKYGQQIRLQNND